jgi:hypothetical protein
MGRIGELGLMCVSFGVVFVVLNTIGIFGRNLFDVWWWLGAVAAIVIGAGLIYLDSKLS